MNDQHRNELVKIATYLISKASQIDYLARRPMTVPQMGLSGVQRRLSSGERIAMDCSEAVTAMYKWAGLKDPNGLGYDGAGNSGDMWHHLTHHYTNPNNAHPGALGVYGPQGDEHVVMVIKHDAHDPILFSHGSEIGPLRISLSDENGAHRGQPFTFLDVAGL
jgi:hypothetical protein